MSGEDREFEQLVGKLSERSSPRPHAGASRPAPDANVRLIARHGSIPLIFWSPWNRPCVEQDHPPDKVLADQHHRGQARRLHRHVGRQSAGVWEPMIVSFANEANGILVPLERRQLRRRHAPRRTIRRSTAASSARRRSKTFRHVVGRVRAAPSAKNVQFVLHLMNYPDPNDKWNLTEHFYRPRVLRLAGVQPLRLAVSCRRRLGALPAAARLPVPAALRPRPEQAHHALRVGRRRSAASRQQGAVVSRRLPPDAGPALFPAQGDRLLAGTLGEQRQRQRGKYSNLKVNSAPETLEAYRTGLASPFYLGEPQFGGK